MSGAAKLFLAIVNSAGMVILTKRCRAICKFTAWDAPHRGQCRWQAWGSH